MTESHCTACDWADQARARLLRSEARRRRLRRERFKPTPEVLEIREYDHKTEQLRRYIRGEQIRKEVA